MELLLHTVKMPEIFLQIRFLYEESNQNRWDLDFSELLLHAVADSGPDVYP